MAIDYLIGHGESDGHYTHSNTCHFPEFKHILWFNNRFAIPRVTIKIKFICIIIFTDQYKYNIGTNLVKPLIISKNFRIDEPNFFAPDQRNIDYFLIQKSHTFC